MGADVTMITLTKDDVTPTSTNADVTITKTYSTKTSEMQTTGSSKKRPLDPIKINHLKSGKVRKADSVNISKKADAKKSDTDSD